MRREDLRDALVYTIDPDDARDFDDAIQVEKTPQGWRIGVHIADVSHYVQPGGALDKEAFLRGNSVYLADRVIPMLPERLSNGICSLKPKVDRLTRSAFIDFDKRGVMKGARFARTVIRSAARLTYKQAYAILTGNTPEPLPATVPDRTETIPAVVAENIRLAWELASILRRNRFAKGSLDLDFPEVKVWLNAEGVPVKMEKIENDVSHQLIEEYMLAANEAVARETKSRKAPALYRIHENPDEEKLAAFRELARLHGFRVGDLTQRGETQRLLELIRGTPEEYALKIGFLKSLKRAAYSTEPLGHYGLAKVNYTHFTSPIRRYADLVVHRVLGDAVDRRQKIAAADLPAVAARISQTERVAEEAERESVKLKKLEFFLGAAARHETFPAVIVDVRNFGLIVELPDYLIGGLVHVSTLADDFYSFDPTRLSFTGRRTRRTFSIGDRIKVAVQKVDTYKRQIDFQIPPEAPAQRGKMRNPAAADGKAGTGRRGKAGPTQGSQSGKGRKARR